MQIPLQGIHPGYGFLSENATFVDIVESAGIAFIGPSSGPMRQMGDKINSKKVAQEAGCFIIPGYAGEVPNEQAAADHAKNIGYPVMIKASAGGGGKGMRVAYDEQQVSVFAFYMRVLYNNHDSGTNYQQSVLNNCNILAYTSCV